MEDNYKIVLEVKDIDGKYGDALTLEHYLTDLINITALKSLGLQLTFSQTTKKRGGK
jgi:hypothetical protein